MKKSIYFLILLIPLYISCETYPTYIQPDFNQPISGSYEGSIDYYLNDSLVSELSFSAYKSYVASNYGGYTLSFDTSIVYTIADLRFKLSRTGEIVLYTGQEYILSSEHYYKSSLYGAGSGVIYRLSIKSIDPDSSYSFRIDGFNKNPRKP